jgi:hypothetical protein
MELIQRLFDEHRALEVLRDRLLALINEAVPDPELAARTRWQLFQALLVHVEFEDKALYQRLVASGNRQAIRVVWQARQVLGAVSEELCGLIADWPTGRMVRHWRQFGGEMRTFLAQLTHRIEYEERLLFPEAVRVLAKTAA